MHHRTVTTSELRVGDIVNCHGMRCLIDREIETSNCHQHLDCAVYWTSTLVLNRDEVPSSIVPLSFTRDRDGRGILLSDEARWTIQGNDLAHWAVEVAS